MSAAYSIRIPDSLMRLSSCSKAAACRSVSKAAVIGASIVGASTPFEVR